VGQKEPTNRSKWHDARRSSYQVGKGLFAGVADIAAMTVSSTLETKVWGRQASTAPAEAAGKVLGVEPTREAKQARFSNLGHWGHGTSWGAKEVAIDAIHYPVYASATGVAYAALDRCRLVESESDQLDR
jgi:hypothetical protein